MCEYNNNSDYQPNHYSMNDAEILHIDEKIPVYNVKSTSNQTKMPKIKHTPIKVT